MHQNNNENGIDPGPHILLFWGSSLKQPFKATPPVIQYLATAFIFRPRELADVTRHFFADGQLSCDTSKVSLQIIDLIQSHLLPG